MTRRAFLALPILGMNAPTRAGVQVRGRLDVTESERTEMTFNLGKACAVFVNDPAMWASVEPMIGTEVVLHLFNP